MVIPETLLFLPGEGRWACLAGRFDGEELYVAVEGTSRTRRFDWAEPALILEEWPGGP